MPTSTRAFVRRSASSILVSIRPFGAGLYWIGGFSFALAFAVIVTIGEAFAYSRGTRPAIDYAASRRPRFTKRQFWSTVLRTIGYMHLT
jgi:hypothetical protein